MVLRRSDGLRRHDGRRRRHAFPFPAGYTQDARDQPAASQWLVWNEAQRTLAAWAPGKGDAEPLLVLGAQHCCSTGW
jgi:hypothetical protein